MKKTADKNSMKWQKYEVKVFETVKTLFPKDNVEHNIRVEGKFSKTKRQIDIAKNRNLPNDFLIYECKDHKNPIDTPKLEELFGKLKNIGAKAGAIVSNSGFTKGALNASEEFDIALYSLINTKDKEILPQLFATVFIEDTYLKSFSFSFQSSSEDACLVQKHSPAEIFFRGSDRKLFSVYDVMRDLWNKGEDLVFKPGQYIYHPVKIKGDIEIVIHNKAVLVHDLAFPYSVAVRNNISKVKIIEASGMLDVVQGSFHAFGNLITENITPYKIQMESKPTDLTIDRTGATFKMVIRSVMPDSPPKKT